MTHASLVTAVMLAAACGQKNAEHEDRPPVEAAKIVRTTATDRGRLTDVIAREQKAGRRPVIAVIAADCPNCATVEKWFTGPRFGKVSVIEVEAEAFKQDLAALGIADSTICFYLRDGGHWMGDLCAMPTGTLGTAVEDSILGPLETHLH